MLGFLEKLTLTPAAVKPDDVIPLRTADISDQAIEDALHVCALFNIIDRIADSLSFAVQSTEFFAFRAGFMLQRGYAFSAMVKKS